MIWRSGGRGSPKEIERRKGLLSLRNQLFFRACARKPEKEKWGKQKYKMVYLKSRNLKIYE